MNTRRENAGTGASASVQPQGKGGALVLQPEEGESYWQPKYANGYAIVKLSPKTSASPRVAMGVQVIAPGGHVREHWHATNEEILFCFAGRGTVIVDGTPHPFVPGTTVYVGPWVKHKIVNDGPGELRMTWTYLPPGLEEYFASIGRPRSPGEPAPAPFERPTHTGEAQRRTGFGPPVDSDPA